MTIHLGRDIAIDNPGDSAILQAEELRERLGVGLLLSLPSVPDLSLHSTAVPSARSIYPTVLIPPVIVHWVLGFTFF